MRGKLVLAVSVTMLAMQIGGPLAAEPSFDQLSEIQGLLARNDIAELRDYLQDNPELLEGDTRLALLLRRFLDESRNLTNYLSDSSDLRSTIEAESEGSDSGDDRPEEGADPDEVEPNPEPDVEEGVVGEGPAPAPDAGDVDSVY